MTNTRRIPSATDMASSLPIPAVTRHYAWVSIGLPSDEPTASAFVGAQVKVEYTSNAHLARKVSDLILSWDLRTDDLAALIQDGPADWGGPLLRDNGFTRERSGLVITTTPCDQRGNNLDVDPTEPSGE